MKDITAPFTLFYSFLFQFDLFDEVIFKMKEDMVAT